MKAFAVSTFLLLLATKLHAAPTSNTRQFEATLTFQGAGASYTLEVPTDGSTFYINNPLSVSSITSEGGATCGVSGADGSETTIVGAMTAAVGPPQPQVSGSCLAL